MDELERTHQETLKAQKEKEQQESYKAERVKAEEEKRNKIAKMRAEKQAKRFLLGLEKEMREKGLDQAFIKGDTMHDKDEKTKAKDVQVEDVKEDADYE